MAVLEFRESKNLFNFLDLFLLGINSNILFIKFLFSFLKRKIKVFKK